MSQLKNIIKDRITVHAAYKRLFDTPDGKTVLAHLMRNGFVFDTTFVKGDTHATALNEGSRRMVLSILKFVNKDHKELIDQIETELQHHDT